MKAEGDAGRQRTAKSGAYPTLRVKARSPWGGDRPRNDVVAKGDQRDGNAGAGSTPWLVLVRSTNAGDPKIGGKGPRWGDQTTRAHLGASRSAVGQQRARVDEPPWGQ